MTHAQDSSKRQLHMTDANPKCKWQMQMADAKDICTWQMQMTDANGCKCLQMVDAFDSCRWQMQITAANDRCEGPDGWTQRAPRVTSWNAGPHMYQTAALKVSRASRPRMHKYTYTRRPDTTYPFAMMSQSWVSNQCLQDGILPFSKLTSLKTLKSSRASMIIVQLI